jgi:TPR repeat protein
MEVGIFSRREHHGTGEGMQVLLRLGVTFMVLSLCGAGLRVAADDSRAISPAERAKLEQQALLGDAKAAYRLLGNAALAAAPGAGDASFWLAVAAENGHPIAQYNLGAMLLGHADARERVRAEYWLARAAKAGDASAAQLLKRVRKGELHPPAPSTKR